MPPVVWKAACSLANFSGRAKRVSREMRVRSLSGGYILMVALIDVWLQMPQLEEVKRCRDNFSG